MIKIALFCGGRGSATIIRELLRWPNIELTLLVNAYDDGLSTGALRRFIPGMLGPSDVRKNLSYLLDLYSDEQYALKNLFEMRLPKNFDDKQYGLFRRYAKTGELTGLPNELRVCLRALSYSSQCRVRKLLLSFFNYEDNKGDIFDYSDCAVGNILFAGCYLENGENFNKAAKSMAKIVGAREKLVNVCVGDDRILVGLKSDGTLLCCEAEVVGIQNNQRIEKLFFVERPIDLDQWSKLSSASLEQKSDWLEARVAPTKMSTEAEHVLMSADIIIYGPGTQHSSLLPSYRITRDALQLSKAQTKILILNIEADNDIEGMFADELIDLALSYMGDPDNKKYSITHVLYNNSLNNYKSQIKFSKELFGKISRYKNTFVLQGRYASNHKPHKHSGYSVVKEVMRINSGVSNLEVLPSIKIYVDPYKRSAATAAIIEEFSEINWSEDFNKVTLEIEHKDEINQNLAANISIKSVKGLEAFPEVSHVLEWIKSDSSDFLVTITGDGQYRFRDIVIGVEVLQQGVFGALYGSRNQSRRQFSDSINAAYNEHPLARYLSHLGAIFLSLIYLIKCGVFFSDPLTGFRIYRRMPVKCLNLLNSGNITPATITLHLIDAQVEIAEMPVFYRTFSGFTDVKWRIKRGLANLRGIL